MKVLYLSNNLLIGFSGGNFASRAFINAFSEIADEFMLLYPDKGQDITPITNKKIVAKGVQNNKNGILRLLDIYKGKINRYIDVAISEVNAYNPDIVVFDGSKTSAKLIEKINQLKIATITIHHNFEVEYYKGTPEPLLWRYAFNFYMKKAEMNAVLKSNLNLTLTNQDSQLLQKNYGTGEILNIKTIGCFEPEPKLKRDEKEIESMSAVDWTNRTNKCIAFAITGSLSAFQTEYSIVDFIENYYPILIKTEPNHKLIIAGRNPSKKIKELCKPFSTITLISNPLDIQPILASSDIYLCPISVGGGLKLRIMDGLGAGLPVLTHKISARGYDSFADAGYLLDYSNKSTFEKSLKQIIFKYKNNEFNHIEINELYFKIFSFESGLERLKKLIGENIIL